MSRYSLFADISGQLSNKNDHNPRVTAAAVLLETASVDKVRKLIPNNLPKWGKCALEDARYVIDTINANALSVAVLSITKNNAAWSQFVYDSERFRSAVTKKDKKPVGFARPTNVTKYFLFQWVITIATAHAIRLGHRSGLINWQGAEAIYQNIICDKELDGDETTALFRRFWMERRHQPNIAAMGLKIITEDVLLRTEAEEPLLMLPDYFAGLVQCSLVSQPGRIQFPLSRQDANNLVALVDLTGKSEIQEGPFNLNFNEMFGSANLAM